MSSLRLLAALGVSAVAVAGLTQIDAGAWGAVSGPRALGVVVDDTGSPVGGAEVRVGEVTTRTDDGGRFELAVHTPAVGRVSATGHLGRAQVLDPGTPARVVLTRSSASAVSLRFGGDAMMGRRFYESQDGASPVLDPGASADDHAAVLARLRPLLADADLTVVNLETPLVEDPVAVRDGVRPSGVHPTKDLVITSSTAMAEGLRLSGVDVVSLGNNHTADALGPGLESTVRALDAAGVAHFGAGDTTDDAWRPAYVRRRGVTVAFLGCTTVTGSQHAVPYVATATTPGAARCEAARLEREVRTARSRADVVVVTLHGGVEYERAQTDRVRSLARTAEGAGAAVVVGSHPHVVGGLSSADDAVFAETLGNLVFDQELWDTLPTYLTRVDLREGRPVAVGVDPVLVDGYRPRPAVGALADAVARIAAGTIPGSARLDAGGAHLAVGPEPAGRTSSVSLAAGTPAEVSPGWWVPAQPGVRVGADLLFGTGTFDDVATGPDGGAGRLWNADVTGTEDGGAQRLWQLGRYARITDAAACTSVDGRSDPALGLELARSPLSTKDAIATIEHRTPVRAGERLSLLADVRRAAPGSRLEVHWYRGMSGGSTSTSVLDVPEGSHDATDCLPMRLDVTVPDGAVAAQVFARVRAPHGGQTLRYLGVDDVRLVRWQPVGEGGRRYDAVESLGGGPVTLTRDDPDVGVDRPVR